MATHQRCFLLLALICSQVSAFGPLPLWRTHSDSNCNRGQHSIHRARVRKGGVGLRVNEPGYEGPPKYARTGDLDAAKAAELAAEISK